MQIMKNTWTFAAVFTFILLAVAAMSIYNARAATVRPFTLYGNYSTGWGFTSGGESIPGPTIVVEQGDTVNLTLISDDLFEHEFFVSYTNATAPISTDPQSGPFTTQINYSFVATDTIGTYTYRCAIHFNVMYGYFQVVATGTIPEFSSIAMVSLLIVTTAIVAFACKRKQQ